jgi:hypothetical protein
MRNQELAAEKIARRPGNGEDGKDMRLFGQLSLFHASLSAFFPAFLPAAFPMFFRGLGA